MTEQGLHHTSLPLRIGFGVIFCLAAGFLFAAIESWVPEAPDQFTYDLRTLWFSKRSSDRPKQDIAIVHISDETLYDYDARSPINRALLAKLLTEIAAAQPKAIGLDFIFAQKTASDQAFIDAYSAVRGMGIPIILGAMDDRWPNISGSALSKSLQFQKSFFEQLASKSGPVVAGHLLFGSHENHVTLGDQAVRYRIEAGGEAKSGLPSFGQLLAEVDGPKKRPASNLISWVRAPDLPGADIFPTIEIPAHGGLSALEAAQLISPVEREILKDKIVLIGGNFSDRDLHQTPLSVLDKRPVPGVDIHAQIIAQLRDGRSIYTASFLLQAILVALAAGLAFVITQYVELESWELLITIAAFCLLIAVGFLMFLAFHFVLPSATITAGWLVRILVGNRIDGISGLIPGRWLSPRYGGET